MKALHIASFKGNVGDIINHDGFYTACNIDKKNVTQLEMRRFYQNANDLYFDDDLVNYINKFDRLILGGGAYFDIRYAASQTGTTLDMSDEFIDKIHIPVLVNAMGIDVDYSNQCAIDRFKHFYAKISAADNWKITLRNDGSKNRLCKLLETTNDEINAVPDNGYVFNLCDYVRKQGLVGMSITNDLFTDKFNDGLTIEQFNKIVSRICNQLLEMGKGIIFFLHAPQDIETFHQIYTSLDSKHFRSKINIAPFDVSSVDAATRLDEYYRKCELVIAMRFHGNVLALKNNIPVIGLAGHEQITGMYSELGLIDQCVIANPQVENCLIERINCYDYNKLGEAMQREQSVMKKIKIEHDAYSHFVNNWLYA